MPSKLMTLYGIRPILVASWCFFGLFVTSLYTCKLTSLLVDVTPPPPFESTEELLTLEDFRWGVIGGTALLGDLRASNNSVMQAVYRGIMTFVGDDPGVLSLDAEVHRVKMLNEKYAFFAEESLLDLWANQDCSIRILRERLFGMETYNFFTPKGSVMAQRVDQVLLQLKASGILYRLQAKWWPRQSLCSQDSSVQTPISLATMQGLFFASAAGAGLALVVLVMEKFVSCWGDRIRYPPQRIHRD